jgi:single-stranded-DNA-specific exonuclease
VPPEPTWVLREPPAESVVRLRDALQIDLLLARLLVLRGLAEPSAARDFLEPSVRSLPDPAGMADAELAGRLLAQAVIEGKHVCVYGDYDVDGISAAALLHTFLAQVGAPPRVFLPDRFRDGYGLHAGRLAELCDQGVGLFVSVDCGTTAVAEIASVRARGVDFIVCDHHALGPQLPAASALLNPQRPDCAYADKRLSAVGVALVLASATRRALAAAGHPGGRVELKPLLEFAALGTIADMVPLQGVNRMLAWHGLRLLGSSRRAGVQALAERSGAHGVGADRVGFQLGPRINAAGRVADPSTAFRLLTTTDLAEARELADRIERENDHRRALQAEVTLAARKAAADWQGSAAVVVADASWHMGVVGIVASKLKDELGVPAFVLAVGDDGLARGSGRSVAGYDLVEGLRAVCADGLAERFGGHAFAAGVTIAADRVPVLRERLAAHAREALAGGRPAELAIDAELQLRDCAMALVEQLDALEPFGKDNPRPTFLLRDVELAAVKAVGKDGQRAQVTLAEPGKHPLWARLQLAGFGPLAPFAELVRGDRVDVVVRLERNDWRGKTSVQAVVEAVAPAGRSPVVSRGA